MTSIIPRPAPVRSLTAIVSAFVALAVLVGAGTAQARPVPDSFADLAERLLPSVVTISSTQAMTPGGPSGEMPPQFQLPPGSPFEEFFKEFFDRQNPQQPHPQRRPMSMGSGFIIDKRGYVVTNNHVIAEADEITVVLNDETIFKAELVGTDPETDLAVLKIDPKGRDLPTVAWGDSDSARVGEWVMAIGNPFGLGGTVTAGIISARGRDIQAGRYDAFIQTDAPINRGNSGGPLFNLNGEVVGINTMIYSPSGGSVGIGFAVPSAVAMPVINQLVETGKVRRGWLGVRIQTVTDEIAESLGLDKPHGALVASVTEDSPAAKAGMKAGDIILSFNDRSVDEMRRLPRIVAETPIGREVDATLWRDGERVTVQVEVGELTEEAVASATAPEAPAPAKQEGATIEGFGLTVAPLTGENRAQYELPEGAKGVVVTDVDTAGPAFEKGMRPGDLIVEVYQKEVNSPQQVASMVEEAKKDGKNVVLFLVHGQSGQRFVSLRMPG